LLLWIGVPQLQASGDRYAAVAFSPSTGQYGYGNGFATKGGAIERARQECGARDAVVKWTRNAWIALAVSSPTRSGYGYGWTWADTAGRARAAARDNCLEHNDDARVVVCVSAYR
jgi:hypothetical protein